MGDTDGANVGVEDGDAEGTPLGLAVGRSVVGDADGAALGAWLCVGEVLGLLDGLLEGDGVVTMREKVMWINLWQVTSAEDVDLIEDLLAAVDGATLTGANKTILKCKVQDVSRATDPSEQVCRSWLTVNITHSN